MREKKNDLSYKVAGIGSEQSDNHRYPPFFVVSIEDCLLLLVCFSSLELAFSKAE